MRRFGFLAAVAFFIGSATLAFPQLSEDELQRLEAARSGSSLSEEEERERANRASAMEAEIGALDENALEAGRKAYESGDHALALERFLAARRADPANPQAALWLGLAYLRLDDPAQASVAWTEFVAKTKDEKLAEEISQHVTILLHEASRREARAAIAREELLRASQADPRTVAVGAFRNLGSEEYAPLGKALSAMLIDNLQAIPDLRVLEREQVQALVDEANLAETGLVESSSAVRAGKLLSAGRVAAGSHVDFTNSPTRLKVQALLVDVDEEQTLASSTKEDLAERFYEIVPAIAVEFAPVLTRKTVQELPPEQQERLSESHTKSLPAAMAFGRALDAKDRQDADEARRHCREAEKEDPDFRLARRVCALIPPVWISQQAVIAAVEAEVLLAASSLGGSAVPWIVGGLVVGGAAAGGAIAASGGGGDGGNGDQVTQGGGNNAPGLQGVVSNASVRVGDTLTMNVSSNDPDGNRVVLSARNLPAGASFTQTAGVVSTGRFSFRPNDGQANQTFVVTFCATDDGNPPAERCRDSSIRVLPRPTPPPSATPTPVQCDPLGEPCSQDSQCCSGQCDFTEISNPLEEDVCCTPLGQSCSDPSGESNCCFGPGFAISTCSGGECCLIDGESCSSDGQCCSGLCSYSGTCFSP